MKVVGAGTPACRLEYAAGGGGQKGISLLEVTKILLTDPNAHIFEVHTHTKVSTFKAADKSTAFTWGRGLQELHAALHTPAIE